MFKDRATGPTETFNQSLLLRISDHRAKTPLWLLAGVDFRDRALINILTIGSMRDP